MAEKDFFLSLGMLHLPTKFHTSRWNVWRGLLCWTFLGGAIRLLYHIHAHDPHQKLSFTTYDAHAKFRELSSNPGTSKMLKVIRGRYRANVQCPSPIAITIGIFHSSNLGGKFCEFLSILKSSNVFVKWKWLHEIQNGWLPVQMKNLKEIKYVL